jgi:uncharacterized protein YbjT (DUF2867 family)
VLKVILFGASGMVGAGVLRECLLADDVEQVVSIGRASLGRTERKLREIVHTDFSDFSAIAGDLTGYDACFFCLGVTSSGKTEAEYSRVTYDYTMAAAEALEDANPEMTFVYVSGAGTDATEKGRSMWARVKGRTENALLALFPNAYMFRPAIIRPMHGAVSRTTSYRLGYLIGWPFVQLMRLIPGSMSSTENIGLAMLQCARAGAPEKILGTRGINALARAARASRSPSA